MLIVQQNIVINQHTSPGRTANILACPPRTIVTSSMCLIMSINTSCMYIYKRVLFEIYNVFIKRWIHHHPNIMTCSAQNCSVKFETMWNIKSQKHESLIMQLWKCTFTDSTPCCSSWADGYVLTKVRKY